MLADPSPLRPTAVLPGPSLRRRHPYRVSTGTPSISAKSVIVIS
jgi:hypothetical protein